MVELVILRQIKANSNIAACTGLLDGKTEIRKEVEPARGWVKGCDDYRGKKKNEYKKIKK